MDVGDVTAELLEDAIGEPFELDHEDQPVQLMLTEVRRLPTASGNEGSATAFSATFSGPAEPLLPQGIRHLRSASFGDLELFLVPIGQSVQGASYEAVFTRVADQP